MKNSSIDFKVIVRSLVLATLLLFIVVGTIQARGYGSGSGEGENHNFYMPKAESRFFTIYDINRDGFLELDEVTAMGMPIRTFDQTDSNKNGKLSKDEFAKMWARPPK